MDTGKPFVIFSSLTEDKGHLLLDDAFWYRNLKRVDPDVILYSSRTSVTGVQEEYPGTKKNFLVFSDAGFLKKINLRLFFIARVILSRRLRNKRIVVQAFDEIAFLFFLLKNKRKGNSIILVLTNNISPERLARSKRTLPFLLRFIFRNCDRVFYHTDFEFLLIRSILKSKKHLSRFFKLKYHLLGAVARSADFLPSGNGVISFFGPLLEAKPVKPVIDLIRADKEGVFEYRFFNVGTEGRKIIEEGTGNRQRLVFRDGYMDYSEYFGWIQQSTYVFLPHNFLYEGKLSGILSDCVANLTPFISDGIEPTIEFFRDYGPMGYIFNYETDAEWPIKFLKDQGNPDKYNAFIRAMMKFRESHREEVITSEFIKNLE